MTVALILVSHSRDLAAGVAELAREMAPAVEIRDCGGTADGRLGTSFDRLAEIVQQVAGPDGAVLLYDLGSALLTAELVLEMADQPDRLRIVDAPLVEGAIAAAVAAASGADLVAVARTAAEAGAQFGWSGASGTASYDQADQLAEPAAQHSYRMSVGVVNPLGLHARPAAVLVRALDSWDSSVTIGRPDGPAVDLRSVLGVIALAVRGGETVELCGTGPDAEPAVTEISDLITTGFGEVPAAGSHRRPVAMGAAPARLGNAPVGRGTDPTWRPPAIRGGRLTAEPGSAGLAVGPLLRLDRAPVQLSGHRSDPSADGADRPISASEERHALAAAIRTAERKLSAGNEFESAHAVLLGDPDLRRAAVRLVDDGADAASAWWTAVTERSAGLAAEHDELVAARAVDLREAGAAVLAELGIAVDRIPDRLDGAIVVSDDLGPGEVPVLQRRGAAGVILTRSSITAHAVIVARGLGIPLVLRAGDELSRLPAGTVLVLDGSTGTVGVDPDPVAVEQVRARIDELHRLAGERAARAREPVRLADGRRVEVVANIGSVADARAAVANGADGIGLLRTELLVLDRDVWPDEDIQCDDLHRVFAELGELPVVVRVLDVGADKPVTALELDPVRNGFLGVRGLRYLLSHPELLRTQLRAICRAAVGHRISVMAPMVSVRSEVLQFRAAVAEAVQSLRAEGLDHVVPERIGVMIEVPSAALAADEICAAADFVSIGTNDLTSYLMAADRTVTEVADLLDPRSTALRRALDMICDRARSAGTPVAVCGEIAGMEDFVADLVDRGVHELSVAPARVPVIKDVLRERFG